MKRFIRLGHQQYLSICTDFERGIAYTSIADFTHLNLNTNKEIMTMSLEEKIHNLPEWLRTDLRKFVIENAQISQDTFYKRVLKAKAMRDIKVLNAISDFLKKYECHVDVKTIMSEPFHLFLYSHQTIRKESCNKSSSF